MTSDEMAFWLMMAFSCCVGVLIGYLMFAPSRSRERQAARRQYENRDDDLYFDDDDDDLGADTDIQAEPFLEETTATRAHVRERARQRMAGSAAARSDAVSSAQQAANAANASLAAKSSSLFGADSLDAALESEDESRRAGRRQAA